MGINMFFSPNRSTTEQRQVAEAELAVVVDADADADAHDTTETTPLNPADAVLAVLTKTIEHFDTMVAMPEITSASVGVAVSSLGTLGIEINEAVQGNSDSTFSAFGTSILTTTTMGYAQYHAYNAHQARIKNMQEGCIDAIPMEMITRCNAIIESRSFPNILSKTRTSIELPKPYTAEKIQEFMRTQGHVIIHLEDKDDFLVLVDNSSTFIVEVGKVALAALPTVTTLVTRLSKLIDPESTMMDQPGARPAAVVLSSVPVLSGVGKLKQLVARQEKNALKAFKFVMQHVYVEGIGLDKVDLTFTELLAQFLKPKDMLDYRKKLQAAADAARDIEHSAGRTVQPVI